MIERSIIGALIGINSVLSYAIISIIAVQGLYLLYLLVKRPYQSGYQNFRLIINELTLLVGLFVSLYYERLTTMIDLSSLDYLPPYVMLGSAIFIVVVGFFSVLAYLFAKCCPSQSVVHPANS